MLRTFPRLSFLSIALLCAGTAGAQTAATAQQPAGQTAQPPATERIETGSDVPTTPIEPRRGTRITEKRNNGQVTEVEVQAGKSHYIMRPNQPAGNAQAGDAQSSAFRAPQWQVMEFDIGPKKNTADAEAAAAAAGTTAPGSATASGTASGAPSGTAGRAPAPKAPPATVPMTRPADIPPPPPLPPTR